MVDEGSAMKTEQGAAGEVQQPSLSEWFCCWDTVEALARDADKLFAKCGTNCSMEELMQWRERIMAQLKPVLEEEERIFQALNNPAKESKDSAGSETSPGRAA